MWTPLLFPLQVNGTGINTTDILGFFTSQSTEKQYTFLTEFDEDGHDTIEITQNITLPLCQSGTLEFNYWVAGI